MVLATSPVGDEDDVGAHGLAVRQRRELGAEGVEDQELERSLLPDNPMDHGGVANEAPQDPGATHQGIYLVLSDFGAFFRLLVSELLLGLRGCLDLFLPAGAQRVEGDLEPLLIYPTDLGGLCSVVVAGAEAGKIHLGAVGLELRNP